MKQSRKWGTPPLRYTLNTAIETLEPSGHPQLSLPTLLISCFKILYYIKWRHWMTNQMQWMIGMVGERDSGKSMRSAQLDYIILYYFPPHLKNQQIKTLLSDRSSLRVGGRLVGCVPWHINPCRLFNAKSSWYIYIKYIWFGLVWFGFIAYQPL